MKKVIILFIILLISAGIFYGGMRFQQSRGSGFNSPVSFQNQQNLSPEERQQRLQELGANASVGLRGGLGGGGGQQGGGFTAGEIIAKDDKSVTVKLQAGGSKIVFLSGSIEITKFAAGALSDIEIGKNISVSGTVNSDGSITAQSIQLRLDLQ